MKIKILLLLLFIPICLLSAKVDTLVIDDIITRTLVLDFNEKAITNNAFIRYSLKGDWAAFKVEFTQGSLNESEYVIEAADYKEQLDGKKGIQLSIQPLKATPSGLYELNMEVIDFSEDLSFDATAFNLSIPAFFYQPPEPMPLWEKLTIILVCLLLLAGILYGVRLFCTRFPEGLLQVSGKDFNLEYELKGKRIVNIEHLIGEDNSISLKGQLVLTKKCFGSYEGPTIHKMDGMLLKRGEEFINEKDIIYPGDAISGLYDIEDNPIEIYYTD